MSVDAIKQFLENTKDYADDTPITIGGKEYPLSSLRQLNASERTQLADRMKSVEEREKQNDTRQANLIDTARKAQEAYAAAEELRAKAGQPAKNTGADPFDDPWLTPVKTALTERDKKYDDLTNQLKTLTNTVTQAVRIAQMREWNREYDSIDQSKRKDKKSRDELLKYAMEQKVYDADGLPSVRKAWDEMTKADRLAEAEAAAREKGREEGRLEAMAARVTAPGVSGPGQPPPGAPLRKGLPNDDQFGDLYAESLKDPDLRGLIEQLGPSMLQ